MQSVRKVQPLQLLSYSVPRYSKLISDFFVGSVPRY